MAAGLIVIEIAAPQVSDDALSVLVSACTRAARDAECVLAKNATDAQPAAVAIVSLQAEDKMRVEVGVHQGDHDSWRTKDFAFLAADDPLDRWRAVGFAIGTLAESEQPAEPKASEPPAPTATPRPPPTSAASASTEATKGTTANGTTTKGATKAKPPDTSAPTDAGDGDEHLLQRPLRPFRSKGSGTAVGPVSIGAAAILGPGLDSGPWRMGSEVTVALALPDVPMFLTLGGSVATRFSRGSDNLTVRWLDVSAGLGVPLLGEATNSGLELRGGVLAEYFDVAASALERSQTMQRWTFGGQGAFAGRVRLMSNFFLTAEVQAAGFSGTTEVHVADHTVGSNASFRYLGSLGLRVVLR